MCDVLIICALKDEYDRLMMVSEGIAAPGWAEKPGPNGWIIAEAKSEAANGQVHCFKATWASHMGREQAQPKNLREIFRIMLT